MLWRTIYRKLILHEHYSDIDVRYLDRWINKYPEYFPKFIIKRNYVLIFNNEKLRYEFKQK